MSELGTPARLQYVRGGKGVFNGQSLAYIRTLLHKKGPTFLDCLSMIELHGSQLVQEPVLGMVLLFDHRFHGDIGLYVGDERQLRIGVAGLPILLPFHYKTSEHYVGAMWWPEEDS
jgi:hypothetical protein